MQEINYFALTAAVSNDIIDAEAERCAYGIEI